jgi:Co/Zn/Cd efflux system component
MKTILNLVGALMGTVLMIAIGALIVWVLWNFFWIILGVGIFITLFVNIYSEISADNNEKENGTIQTPDTGDRVA